MEKKRENRKVQYTKRVIKDSFLELLKTKNFNQITVKEITELADVNRTTFYAHYDNCEALTREIEAEMAQQVINAMDKLYQKVGYETEVISALFDAMEQRKEMCMWMLSDRVTGCGSQMIQDYARKICVPRWKQAKGLTDEQAEWFLSYIYGGAIGFMKQWYQQGFSGDAEDRRRQFEEIIRCTLYYIYNGPSGYVKAAKCESRLFQ